MARPSAGVEPLGRGAPATMLRDVLDRLSSGQGGCAVVSGEAGIGKSALVDWVLSDVLSRGVAVVAGGASEIEADRPFGAIADAADRADEGSLLEVLAAMQPGAQLSTADRSVLVADALGDALESAAANGGGGAVLVLEDLHWADAGTVAVLWQLRRLLRMQAVALVVTIRPTPRRRDLELLVHELRVDGAADVALGPLTPDDVAAVVERHLGATPRTGLLDYLSGCSGNPFYVLELVDALRSAGPGLVRSGGSIDVAPSMGDMPPSMRDTILRRLGYLPASTVRLLTEAALLGCTFTVPDLAAVSGVTPTSLLEPLVDAHRAHVIADVGERWSFRHDLVRDALIQSVPIPSRRAMHVAAAQSLEAAGRPQTLVARQYALGADVGDRRAVVALRTAGLDALRSAPAVGIELLETALSISTGDAELLARVTADLMDPLDAMGRHADVERLARAALASATTADVELELRRGLALAIAALGDIAGALAVLDELAARPDVIAADLAVVHATAAALHLVALDMSGVTRRAALARAAADATGDPRATAFASNATALALVAHGRPGEAVAALASVDRPADLPYWAGYNPPLTASLAALMSDDFAGAARHLGEAAVAIEAAGIVRWRAQYTAIETLLPYLAGDLDAAQVACETALSSPVEDGPRFQVGVPSALLAMIAWRRGDLDRAEEHASAAEAHYQKVRAEIGVEFAWLARALVTEARGDQDGAFDLLRQAWRLSAPVRFLVSDRILGPELARLAVGRDADLGRAIADELAEGAQRNAVASALGNAALCGALVAGSAEGLVEAVAYLERSPRRLELAGAAAHAAVALRVAGARRPSARYVALARQVYVDASADGDLGRLRQSLGIRWLGPAPRPTSGWGSLTPTEDRVVGLVRSGLTNRQIGDELGTSRRTVETHLAHVFGKLGVNTRVELAVEAAGRS